MSAGLVFQHGVAAGLIVLVLTAYRRISPAWLKSFLIALACVLAARYVALALEVGIVPDAQRGALSAFGRVLGWTIPALFAVDQLVRHPAMTPAKLLPIAAGAAAVFSGALALAAARPALPVAGWALGLEALCAFGFVVFVAQFLKAFRSGSTRFALLGLVAGQILLVVAPWLPPMAFWSICSEAVALLLLWHAFDTSARSFS